MSQVDEQMIEEAVYRAVKINLDVNREKSERHLEANFAELIRTMRAGALARPSGYATWACFAVLCLILWRVW